jgi:predicted amidohydrolase
MSLTLRIHQISFSWNKIENMNIILHLTDESDAYLDVFPEYAMGVPPKGLNTQFVHENAESIDGEFVNTIVGKTDEKSSAIVFTAYLKERDELYNASILAEKGEIKSVYSKIHLFDAFGFRESDVFAPRKELAITDLKDFKIGLAVCFDLRFPEHFRVMARMGVNLFIVPSAWFKGKYKITQWRTLTLARSNENNSYLIAVNQANPFFIGHSIATPPLGYVIKEAGEEQKSFTRPLDYETIEQSKQSLPMISLSKHALYKKLFSLANDK